MVSGIFNCAIFSRRVWCRTVSNALLKSRAMTMMYWLVESRLVTVCSSDTSAAVVDPVGRKANWSPNAKVGGGVRRAGYRICQTMIRSIILVSTGVMDIGLNSDRRSEPNAVQCEMRKCELVICEIRTRNERVKVCKMRNRNCRQREQRANSRETCDTSLARPAT